MKLKRICAYEIRQSTAHIQPVSTCHFILVIFIESYETKDVRGTHPGDFVMPWKYSVYFYRDMA